MNVNDCVLTGLWTCQSGTTAEDNAPNAGNLASFDLLLEGVAGPKIGNCGRPYTLSITAIDLTTVTDVSAIGVPGNPLTQTFGPINWTPNGINYELTQQFAIEVPGGGGPGAPLTGHTFQYVASLVSHDAQIVSIIQSNLFVLV
jgi:hypothetical protein